MKSESVEFGYNARRVYTAVKKAFLDSGAFRGIRCDDRAFRIEASHGLPIWGEDVEIKVVATGVNSSEVRVKSSDKLFINLLKWGNNKRNVGNIMDFVRNEVYRLLPMVNAGDGETSPVVNDGCGEGSSVIRLKEPDIRLRK